VRAFLARTPLRVKLVAASVALVLAALLVTASATVVSLRSYLLKQVDAQLTDATVNNWRQLVRGGVPVLPSDFLVRGQTADGVGQAYYYSQLHHDDLPPLPDTPAEVADHLGVAHTVWAANHSRRWRILVTELPNGEYFVIGEQLVAADNAVARLVLAELVAGAAVLVVLALVGFALVRASLGPLREIEHTAAQIAGGDLSRRVPESDPRTEVGQVAQALNAMLTQIEGAFAARAASEQAARASEASARTAETAAVEAATAAQVSESRARQSEERMRQFVADASHELRTPLTTIRGFAELYRQGAVEPEQTAKLLRRIEDEAARMGLLVEDLLLLARLDQERPLVLGPVELRILAGDTVAAARVIDPERPITLDVVEGGRPILVLGDEPRLRQVLGNLVTNALTHTPAGTPVAVRLTSDGTTAVVEVADEGPGIAPEQADRVFQRFYRVDKARTRRAYRGGEQPAAGGHSGAGLGLAIVAALVAAHDGTVEVRSEPGHGATFQVRLPLLAELPDQDESVLPETSQPDPSSGEVSPGIVGS
jgi:two-component system OmpR family sensor kinase